jgi:colanic acid biosynthesis glycosyl transferase WcaI
MKILIYGLNYWPELIGTGKYTAEMAQWLARRGHEVRVVTAYPYYPQWRIGERYRGKMYSRERAGGVVLHRCPLWVPRSPSTLRRVLHLASFAGSSAPIVLWQGLTWRPDVVMGIEPTLLAAPATLMAAWLGGARSWLHVQDFEIEAAFGVGLLGSSRLRHYGVALEEKLLRRFHRVSSISPAMCERLRQKGLAESQIKLVPNWVAPKEIHPLPEPSPLRRELGIGSDMVVALYAGNMSEKQGLETLVAAAERLRHETGVLFVFAGEGAARHRLERMSASLSNVKFLPLQPAERLNELLNLADIHLLPQRRQVADLVMPSKLLGMMASGRPVVACAEVGSSLASTVSGCGIVVPPEDGSAIAGAILALAGDSERRLALGDEARNRVVREWGRDSVLSRLARWFEEEEQRQSRTDDREPVLPKVEAPSEGGR